MKSQVLRLGWLNDLAQQTHFIAQGCDFAVQAHEIDGLGHPLAFSGAEAKERL